MFVRQRETDIRLLPDPSYRPGSSPESAWRHLLGHSSLRRLVIGSIAAWFLIPIIVLAGMVLTPTSLGIAFISFRGCRPIGFYYGLATPNRHSHLFFPYLWLELG